MNERRIFRYVVSIDDEPHEIALSHSPVAVAAIGDASVEFWAEHTQGATQIKRRFQVFGTGHILPDGARWIGTCARTYNGFVWHLYELPHS